jgi:hypothetical protein
MDIQEEPEVVEEPDKNETTPPQEQEAEQPAPKPPKKRPPRPQPLSTVPRIDPAFWTEMLTTKRELDREATRTRYANLVKF